MYVKLLKIFTYIVTDANEAIRHDWSQNSPTFEKYGFEKKIRFYNFPLLGFFIGYFLRRVPINDINVRATHIGTFEIVPQ